MRAAWKKFQRWVADRVRSPWALLLFPLCALLILAFFPARLLWGVLPLGTGPLPENLFVALSQSDSARQQFELWLKVAGGFVVLIGFWQLAQSRRQFAWERVEKACALLLEQGPDGSPSDAHREIGLVLLQEAFEKQREARSLIIRIIRRYVQQQTRIRPVAMREGQQGALAEEDCPAGVHPLSRTMEVFFRASSNHRKGPTAPFVDLELQGLELRHPYFEGMSFDGCDLRGSRFVGQATDKTQTRSLFRFSMRNCLLAGTLFENLEIDGCDFSGSELNQAGFRNVKWIKANLADTQFLRTDGLLEGGDSFLVAAGSCTLQSHDFATHYPRRPEMGALPQRKPPETIGPVDKVGGASNTHSGDGRGSSSEEPDQTVRPTGPLPDPDSTDLFTAGSEDD